MNKLITLSLLIISLNTYAFGMRCQGQLIEEGDSVAKVIQYCGTPQNASGNGPIYSADVLVYRPEGDGVYILHIVNSQVERIEWNRS